MGAFKSMALHWKDATGRRDNPTNADLEDFRQQLAAYDAMHAEMVERDRRDWEIRDDPRMDQLWPDFHNEDDPREVR